MRRLLRRPLPERVSDGLLGYQRGLAPEAPVESYWEQRRGSNTLKAVEAALRALAPGRARCMYCDDSEGCDIDHFEPKATAAGRQRVFDWDNLLWACTPCNRAKLNRFDPEAINPTHDDPMNHLVLSSSTGCWEARVLGGAGAERRDARGEATLRSLDALNRQSVAIGRAQAGKYLCEILLPLYATYHAQGDLRRAALIQSTVTTSPFSDVFAWMLRVDAENPATTSSPIGALVSQHPEMQRWLADADEARWEAAAQGLDELARGIRRRRSG